MPPQADIAASTKESIASPTSPTTNGNSSKRKRGTSSRGVANLTPDQLERKRANDREAQRAIRERTKLQIDRLNARIAELENSQPYHDLQVVQQEKNAVIQENEEMKKQLASFVAIFQKWIPGAQGLEDLAAAAERNPLPFPTEQSAYPAPQIVDSTSPHTVPSIGSPPNPSTVVRQYEYPTIAPASNVRGEWASQTPAFDASPRNPNIHPDLAADYNQPSDTRLNVGFLLDSNQRIARMKNGLPPEQNNSPARDALTGPHSALPRLGDAECPLDALLMDFLAERQRMAAQGANSEALVGPLYPNFNALLNRGTPHYSHPLSTVFTDILRTFPDLSNLPEQVAVVHIMFLLMRWYCEPTKANYERMPEWIRPRPTQLFTVHPAWLDFLPWPRLRDVIIQSSTYPPFESFFIPYTTTLSVNWPYSPRDVLLPSAASNLGSNQNQSHNHHSPHSDSTTSQQNDEPLWRMNPVFESHILNLDNWSLGTTFKEHFPAWAHTVRIKETSGLGLGRLNV